MEKKGRKPGKVIYTGGGFRYTGYELNAQATAGACGKRRLWKYCILRSPCLFGGGEPGCGRGEAAGPVGGPGGKRTGVLLRRLEGRAPS